jgi:Protein of unknown function (DUF1569)
MALPNIFSEKVSADLISRLNKLSSRNTPNWGKMSVDQMLAHCNVTYEMTYEDIHPKPNIFLKFIMKKLVKNKVVSEVPYGKSGKTAPQFIITGIKNFENEKARLISYIQQTVELGENHFDGKESHSFGNLTKKEWSNMFYKHLDHHLTQFGV